jgi:hypothetical protein
MSDTPNGNPADGFDVLIGSQGRPLGPKLLLPLFVPYGQSIIMQGVDGLWYEVTAYALGNGTATLQIQQVTL